MDAEPHNLFRHEAIQARRAPEYGEPLLPSSLAHSVAACAAIACLAAGIALVVLLEVPRRATVRGYIAPDLGLVRIHPPLATTLRMLAVTEGERVGVGQLLAVLAAPIGSHREPVLRAPVAGTVTTIAAQAGATVSPNRPLLALLPEGATLEAHLLVPSRDAGLLRSNQAVVLRLDAFPYQRFGAQRGRVRSVAGSIQLPGEVEGPVALDAPAYSVVVALESASVHAYQREWPLRPGLLLEADVILERVPLYRRLLDPLRAIGRLGG
jgi:multidrug efflux pump subunit AcrA (membrane-fusion protein)